MKIAWSKADFQSLRALLDRELNPGETIIWCGYPSTDFYKGRCTPYAVKLFSGVAIYVVLGSLLHSLISHYVAIHPGIVAYGLGPLFAVYMIAIWPDAVYAVTTKRIIAVRWVRIHDADLSQIKSYSEEKHGAWTNLVFSLPKGGCIRFCGISQDDMTESIAPFLLKVVSLEGPAP